MPAERRELDWSMPARAQRIRWTLDPAALPEHAGIAPAAVAITKAASLTNQARPAVAQHPIRTKRPPDAFSRPNPAQLAETRLPSAQRQFRNPTRAIENSRQQAQRLPTAAHFQDQRLKPASSHSRPQRYDAPDRTDPPHRSRGKEY